MVRLTRAERFKDARTVHNQHGKQTMDSVAAATNITKSVIHALEDEKTDRDVGYKTVAALANHYGVSAHWLLGLTDDHKLLPSAVDDLSLSAAAVDRLMSIGSHEYSEELTEALNLILEDPQLFTLLLRVKMVTDAVITETEHLQHIAQEAGEDDPNSFGLLNILLGDQITSGVIENEIITAHPELAGRITVDFGQNSLERRIEELGNSFTSLIKYATGYHDLETLRIGGKI